MTTKYAIKGDHFDAPDQVHRRGPTLSVDIWYPGVGENATHVEVGLCSVRATDSIRIHYSFDRNGFVIEQASRFEFEANDKVCDPDWQEVAFVQSWGREIEPVQQGGWKKITP